jgi:hypothetical protein
MIAYFNNTYLDKEKVHISPDDRGFLFADGLRLSAATAGNSFGYNSILIA